MYFYVVYDFMKANEKQWILVVVILRNIQSFPPAILKRHHSVITEDSSRLRNIMLFLLVFNGGEGDICQCQQQESVYLNMATRTSFA